MWLHWPRAAFHLGCQLTVTRRWDRGGIAGAEPAFRSVRSVRGDGLLPVHFPHRYTGHPLSDERWRMRGHVRAPLRFRARRGSGLPGLFAAADRQQYPAQKVRIRCRAGECFSGHGRHARPASHRPRGRLPAAADGASARRRPLRRGFVYRRLSGPPAKPGRTRFLRRTDAHGRPSLSQVK